MNFNDTVSALKSTYSRRIFENYGYNNTRKKYTALESADHNNGDKTPSMALHDRGGSFYLKDFAGQQKMYSSIDLIMLQEGFSFADAVKYGAEMCGIEIDKGPQQRVSKLQFFLEHNGIRYDYNRIDNLQYDCTKWRKPDKKFEWGIYKGSEYIPSRKENPISRHALSIFCNGRIKELKNAIANGTLICYPEGEKDVITLWKNGYVSFTFGGTKTFKDEILPYLKGGNFLVFADNDEKGIEDAENVMRKLNTVGVAKMIIPSDIPKGDISDYMREHTKEDLQKLINVTMSQETVTKKTSKGNSLQDAEPDKMQFHLTDKHGVPVGVFDVAIENYIVANQKLFIYGGTPFLYRNGCYFPDWTKAELSTSIREKIFDNLIKSTTIDRVYRLFLTDARIQKSFEEINAYPAEWICFKNGMYDPIGKKMIPHDEKYCCINQVPYEYHPETSPKAGEVIEDYLNFICDGKQDTREMLLQYMGYSMTQDTRQQKFLILTGEGGSGKSTLIKCFEMLVGRRNISNVSLTDLQQRFSSVELMGKLINSCADLEIGALTDTSMIKKIVGEDFIKGEKKGKDLVFFKNSAKLIFSTNELPVIKSEKTNAFYRRLLVLPMSKVTKRVDPNLFNKLEAEKDYLLTLAVQALERMYQQENITISDISKHEIERLRADSDTVEGFILEECEKVDGYRAERTELYKRYSAYCEESERQALTKNNFYKSLRLKDYSEITSNGKRYFLGLKSALENCTNDGFIQVTPEQLEDLPFD